MSHLSSTLHMSWKIKEGCYYHTGYWMRNKMLYKYYIHKVCAGVGDLKKKISSKDLFLDSESQNFFKYY